MFVCVHYVVGLTSPTLHRMNNPPSPRKMQRLAGLFDLDSDGNVRLSVVRRVLALAVEEATHINAENFRTLVVVAETEETMEFVSDAKAALKEQK